MGEVTVNNHIGAGLYSVSVDTGTVQRDGRVSEIDARIAEIDADLSNLIVERDAAQAALDSALSVMNSAIDAFILAPTDDNQTQRSAVTSATEVALRARGDLLVKEILVNELEFEKTALELDKKELTDLVLENDMEAWCCDLTVGASGDVASIEVPGENDLILIAPGASAPVSDDGHLEARGVQFGHQCYYNAAILPGWQKFLPTYRLAEITGFNADQTCSVTIDAASSSTLGLDINMATDLIDVPIEYMTCNRAAFLLNDRVVVKFDGQSWDSPKVVGFESNPRGCSPFIIGPAYSLSPRDDYVSVYPAGEGIEPVLLRGDDQLDKIKLSNFGALNKFAHDTEPYIISSSSNFAFSKGSPVISAIHIRAVFAVSGGRFITVFSDGTVNSSPVDGLSGSVVIATLPYSIHIYTRPDGGKIYGFDGDGYCSAIISSDGLSAVVDSSQEYAVADANVTSEVKTGNEPEDDPSGTSGSWTRTVTTTGGYSGPIGVFWTGSTGAWTEQIVTLESAYNALSVESGSWERPGGLGFPTSGTKTIANTSLRTTDIDAGDIYTKRIADIDGDETRVHTWDGATTTDDNTLTITFISVLPRILGNGDYIEEIGNFHSVKTTTYYKESASSAIESYNNVISYGGNTAKHNGVNVKQGETTIKTVAAKPVVFSSYDELYYRFGDESAYVTLGHGVFDIILKNNEDERIAEKADSFVVSDFAMSEEKTIDGEVFGSDESAAPYVSTYGYLEDEISTIATVY